MIFQFHQNGFSYEFDSTQPLDISLPIKDGRNNPNCYYAEPVSFETIRAEEFIGDISKGGSVNHKKIILTPHGNGTHTECYGHISSDKEATLINCVKEFLFLAQLISVPPRKNRAGDSLITLEDVYKSVDKCKPEALILRSLPNNSSKKNKQYSGKNPTYLEPALGAYLAESKISHLIVDLPSVDREVDGGLLLTHKYFWQYPHLIRKNCTITELAFIPDTITDGIYLLNLQISSFDLDVSPSKPVLYALKKL
jgi:kynurenine formamidase